MTEGQWTLSDKREAGEAIKRLGEEELLFLNSLVVERLKLIAQARSTAQMARFNVGERVGFRAPSGEWKAGVVQKLNKKTVTVHTDGGHKWNVAPGLLSPASDLPGRTRQKT